MLLAFAYMGWTACAADSPHGTIVAPPDARLAVVTEPGGAASGLPLGAGPVLEVQDGTGNRLNDDNGRRVTAEIHSGGGSLHGTTTVSTDGGVATFTGLTVRGAVGAYQLRFTAEGFDPVTSEPFLLEPGPPSLSGSPIQVSRSTIVRNETSELRLDVLDAEGNHHATGGLGVTFSQSGDPGVGTIGSTTDRGDGTYAAEFTGGEPGTVTIGASINGESVTSARPTVSVQASATDTTSPVPLTMMDGITYLGFPGGLYPSGNDIPAAHEQAGAALASTIEPLDASGQPSANGRYVLLSVGMSNTALEFKRFIDFAGADPTVNNTELRLINGGQGGKPAPDWETPTAGVYNSIKNSLERRNLSERQVQVVWLKTANSMNKTPNISLPDPNASAFALLRSLGNIVRSLRVRYPNVKLVFLSSRIYAGYATSGTSPEPYAYEGGYAVKWLIEAQIRQNETGEIDSRTGDLSSPGAPWLAWGPYIWADGPNPNPDGLFWLREDLRADDGTHPSESGQDKVAEWLMRFFKGSPLTTDWFLR